VVREKELEEKSAEGEPEGEEGGGGEEEEEEETQE
jgi:hypothetical protein